MTAMTAFGEPAPGFARLSGRAQGRGQAAPTYAVTLVDRRTGAALRLNGGPVTLYSRDPEAARAELLRSRNPALWDVRVEPIHSAGRSP